MEGTYSNSYGLDVATRSMKTYGLGGRVIQSGEKWPELNPSRIEWDRIPRDP